MISTIIIIRLFTVGEADYYEDVLLSTEINFQKLKAVKEGKRVTTVKKVKVNYGETGIKKGIGASVLFYKQIVDMKRNSKIPFVDKYTISITIGAGILCYIVNKPSTGMGLFCILVVPAVAAGIVAFMLLPPSIVFLVTLPYTLCCILVTVIAFVICRNIFCVSEYKGKM